MRYLVVLQFVMFKTTLLELKKNSESGKWPEILQGFLVL